MEHEASDNGLHIIAIEIGMLNAIQKGITPVQPVSLVINGDSVGPAELLPAHAFEAGAVVVDTGDVGRSLPFGEENETFIGMNGDGSRPGQIGHDDASPGGVAQTDHRQGRSTGVQKEEQLRRPVDCDPFDTLVLREDHRLLSGAIGMSSVDDIGHHIGEVDEIVPSIKVHSDKVRATETADDGHDGVREGFLLETLFHNPANRTLRGIDNVLGQALTTSSIGLKLESNVTGTSISDSDIVRLLTDDT
jgi:hypothetical protein